jgi:aminoglycoside phosphotransferase (APT) family kinase protein
VGGALAAGAGRLSARVSDTEVQQAIAARVREIVPALHGAAAGPLQRNVFSFVFRLDAPDPGVPGVYVKIPKADLRRGGGMLPITHRDRALGAAEYASLQRLAETWPGAGGHVRYVEPVAYVEEFNAVVTARADADEALAAFRRLAVLERLRFDARILGHLSDFGAALRRFHEATATSGTLDVAGLRAKIRRYAATLADSGVAPALLGRVAAAAQAPAAVRTNASIVTTLKGIDVRNLLLDRRGQLHIVDPGAMKLAPPEADLARFLVTWRILFWGSPSFAAGVAPSARTEASLLEAYGPFDSAVLDWMLLKELLKHWQTAHESLRLKGWGGVRRRAVAAVYIDRFYRAQVAAAVSRIRQ